MGNSRMTLSCQKKCFFSRSLALLLILLSSSWSCCHAKKVSGDVRLSGRNSEHVLTKFALSPYARGSLELELRSRDMYENEQSLKLHFYMDSDWRKFRKATTCEEKISVARQVLPVSFDYDASKKLWKAKITSTLNQERIRAIHYWYFVLDDCSLERFNQDSRIPKLHYELTVWNDRGGRRYLPMEGGANAEMQEREKVVIKSHFGADEIFVTTMPTFLLSMLIALLLGWSVYRQVKRARSVHAALILVITAALLDASSSLCERIHVTLYGRNGVGSYFFDSLSTHFEAMTDSLVCLVLLSIASGWTLPSDVVPIPQGIQSTWLQSTVQGMRNPAGALVTMGPAGILAMSVIVAHTVLAQWGRTYDDDFDSYHELEHTSGRVLMAFRMLLGVFFVLANIQTRRTCPPSLQPFYIRLALVGTLWFFSLPFFSFVWLWLSPEKFFHLRKPTVVFMGAVIQSMSLVMLAWFVTSHSKSAYHKMSRLHHGKDDLTGDLANSNMPSSNGRTMPSSWTLGKAKIRLD